MGVLLYIVASTIVGYTAWWLIKTESEEYVIPETAADHLRFYFRMLAVINGTVCASMGLTAGTALAIVYLFGL